MTIHWRAFELRPPETLPVAPEYAAQVLAKRPAFEAYAREHYGVDGINPGPFGINSRPAHIGGKIAEAHGAGPAYHDAVMRAYFEQAADISQPDVLGDIAQAAGLARASFLASLTDARYLDQALSDVHQARVFGLTGVPAMVFERTYLLSGARPYDVLAQAVDNVAAELAKQR